MCQEPGATQKTYAYAQLNGRVIWEGYGNAIQATIRQLFSCFPRAVSLSVLLLSTSQADTPPRPEPESAVEGKSAGLISDLASALAVGAFGRFEFSPPFLPGLGFLVVAGRFRFAGRLRLVLVLLSGLRFGFAVRFRQANFVSRPERRMLRQKVIGGLGFFLIC